MGSLESLRRRYEGRADFRLVYIREAHPADGWRLESNDREGVVMPRHRSQTERRDAARGLCSDRKLQLPVLVDGMDDAAAEAYSAFPDRLYLVDRQSRIAFKGGRGPFSFDLAGLEQALCLVLLHEAPRTF